MVPWNEIVLGRSQRAGVGNAKKSKLCIKKKIRRIERKCNRTHGGIRRSEKKTKTESLVSVCAMIITN